MKITVVYGRRTDIDNALQCGFCHGKGTRDMWIRGKGEKETCMSCSGKGWSYRNGYCYYAPADEPVAPGDIVLVPPSELFPEREATVVALDSDWNGQTKRILGVIERASERTA